MSKRAVRGAQFSRPNRKPKPPTPVFDVWIEGYAATGGSSRALFLGKHAAETFELACIEACRAREMPHDPHNNTVWGCRMFDNEEDARKEFG